MHPIPRAERLIGRTIGRGRICLVEPLGHGSGGVVFRAIAIHPGTAGPKEFAVKCMFKAAEGSVQQQFQRREIHFHSAVSAHPNILTLHEIVDEGRYLFLVLDYCAGGDMFKFLTESHTYRRDDELVRRVFVQLIDAVQACHSSGIYHRDIKPDNIMCNKEGTEVLLGDFGLSTNSRTSSNFGAGTTGYMSPECIGYQGGPEIYSPRSNDVWSLGIILTSMISGHNPWKAAVMTDDCFRAFIRDPNFLQTMLPISKAASAILQRIFVSPDRRIRLPKLRDMVMATETFFMTDEEIAASNVYVQAAAASYLGHHPSASSDGSACSALVVRIMGKNKGTVEMKEDVKAEAEVKEKPISPTHHVPLPRVSPPHLSTLNVASHAAPRTKRPRPPPPQPVPSFGDLVKTVPPDSGAPAKKRISGFFRRVVDRIFIE